MSRFVNPKWKKSVQNWKKCLKVMMMMSLQFLAQILCLTVVAVQCDPVVSNTTVAATNIESTISTPAILIDPTTISSQNTTDTQYEVSARPIAAGWKIRQFRSKSAIGNRPVCNFLECFFFLFFCCCFN